MKEEIISPEVSKANREQRRFTAKKLGKQGRAGLGTITDTVKKLTYIHLIEKLRELNEKKEKKENETIN